VHAVYSICDTLVTGQESNVTQYRLQFQVAALVCLATVARSPVVASESTRLVLPTLGSEETSGVIRVEIDSTVYQSMISAEQVVVEGFPLPGKTEVRLELTSFEVLTPTARFVVVDGDGQREVPPPAFRAFRGVVTGEPESRVTLNLFGGRIAGFIRLRDEEFVVALGATAGGATIRARASDPDRPDTPWCGAVEHGPTVMATGDKAAPLGAPAIDADTLLNAQIAIDATYEWYDHFGSLEDAQNYILNLMAQVSTIYVDEVNVELEVPFLRVFTIPDDPYAPTTNTSTLLANLRSEWNSNQTGVSRTVTHLFSWRSNGGAGIAYLDALCSAIYSPGNSFDYGVSTMSALGSWWEKGLVAHELGHNFSSPHTHCYSPEIDQCANEDGCYQGSITQSVGTIMSYCNSFTSTFHQRVEDEAIRPAAEAAYPSCISAVVAEEPPPAPQNLVPF
jgi:hypothetical protein